MINTCLNELVKLRHKEIWLQSIVGYGSIEKNYCMFQFQESK